MLKTPMVAPSDLQHEYRPDIDLTQVVFAINCTVTRDDVINQIPIQVLYTRFQGTPTWISYFGAN